MKKSRTHISVYPDSKIKFAELKFEIQNVQKRKVGEAELFRRMLNISPIKIKELLIDDAYWKRRKKNE